MTLFLVLLSVYLLLGLLVGGVFFKSLEGKWWIVIPTIALIWPLFLVIFASAMGR